MAVHSGKVLDVANSSPADGANVQQWTYNGGYNQQWQLVPVTSARTAAAVIQTMTTDEVAAHDIIVYPNPVASELVVKLANGFEKGSVITVTDVTGRLLRNLPVMGTEYNLPISALSSGVYFIKISNGEKSITKKIIKQ
jgi:glucosylceramidase